MKPSRPLDAGWIEAFHEIDRTRKKSVLAQISRIFLKRVPGLLETLRQNLEDGDGPAVEHTAHALASNCSSVGALDLSRVCAELEALTAAGDLEAAGRLLPKIESGYQAVVLALEQLGYTEGSDPAT